MRPRAANRSASAVWPNARAISDRAASETEYSSVAEAGYWQSWSNECVGVQDAPVGT